MPSPFISLVGANLFSVTIQLLGGMGGSAFWPPLETLPLSALGQPGLIEMPFQTPSSPDIVQWSVRPRFTSISSSPRSRPPSTLCSMSITLSASNVLSSRSRRSSSPLSAGCSSSEVADSPSGTIGRSSGLASLKATSAWMRSDQNGFTLDAMGSNDLQTEGWTSTAPIHLCGLGS